MKWPAKLNKGDTVGLICPSSAVATERIPLCVKAVEDLGYKVKLADNLDDNYAGYMAGSGKVRADWINRMFADPEIKAIFCIRGGDGGTRTMEFIDYDIIRKNPKIFVGYSDVTSMNVAFPQNCGLVTFHGPMVSSNMIDKFDEKTRTSFFEAINGDGEYTVKNPEGFEIKVLKPGKATGKLVGGNLSLLSASIGTPYEVDTRGNILFIEEVCEPMSKIEKWTYHLRNSGKLKECSGILLGQFTNVYNKECPDFDEIKCISDILEGIDIPVMYNIQSGHGFPMITLPMGAECSIDTEKKQIVCKIER